MTSSRRDFVGQTTSRATPADCSNCPAEGSGLFSRAFRTQRAYLVQGFRIVHMAPQETLYRYGDAADHVYLLRYGLLKLVCYSSGGEERIVRLARKGDAIGLEALTGDTYRHAAKAVVRSALCRVPTNVILEEERADPRFVDRVMAEMQRDLHQAELFLTELSTGTVPVRVARLLLHLAEREDDGRCALPMRDEIAALLGIGMETASRTVSEFRRRGLIRAAAEAHRIDLDVAGLQGIAVEKLKLE